MHTRRMIVMPDQNFDTLPWLPYTLFNPSCRVPLPPLSLSLLEDVDDDAFLDSSHEYRGLQSDVS